jgi:hypothetical protein
MRSKMVPRQAKNGQQQRWFGCCQKLFRAAWYLPRPAGRPTSKGGLNKTQSADVNAIVAPRP